MPGTIFSKVYFNCSCRYESINTEKRSNTHKFNKLNYYTLPSLMIHSDAKGGLDISYSLINLEHLPG